MTPETSERFARAITNSTEDVVGGAFQYECCDPQSNGASSDNNGADPGAVSTYNSI